MTTIRVLLVDDQVLMRQGLRKLLAVEDGIEVAGEAADGVVALESVRRDRPDVALVDARMPRMDGVELIRRMTAEHPQVACLVLSTFDEDDYIFGALRAGARGYLLKDCSPDELVAGIRRAYTGETVLGGPAAARVVASLREPRSPGPVTAGFPGAELLSRRELDVVGMIVNGASNREIAARLFITEGTVKNHVSSALRKLGLRDRTQLALHVTGSGWVVGSGRCWSAPAGCRPGGGTQPTHRRGLVVRAGGSVCFRCSLAGNGGTLHGGEGSRPESQP